MTYRKIDLANITRDENQPRQYFDDASLERLAASLKRFGMLQPITVTAIEDAAPDAPAYMIVDGERRVRAAQALGWKAVPAILGGKEVQETQGRKEAQLVANVLRDELLPSELAKGLKESQVEGSTVRDLEALLGIPKSEISDRVKALQAPDECRAMIDAGTVSYQVGAAFALTVKVKTADDKTENIALQREDVLPVWEMVKAEAERTGKPITRMLTRSMVKAQIDSYSTPDDETPGASTGGQADTGAASVTATASTTAAASDKANQAETPDASTEEDAPEETPEADATDAHVRAEQLQKVGSTVRRLLTDAQGNLANLQGFVGDASMRDTLTDAICEMAGSMDPEGLAEAAQFVAKYFRTIADAAKAAHARRVVSEQAAETNGENPDACGAQPGCDEDVWLVGDDGVGRCYAHNRAYEAVQDIDGQATADAIAELQDHVNGARV